MHKVNKQEEEAVCQYSAVDECHRRLELGQVLVERLVAGCPLLQDGPLLLVTWHSLSCLLPDLNTAFVCNP